MHPFENWYPLVVLCTLAGGPLAHAEGDATRGARLFRQCAACHSTAPGEHLTGPSLSGVWNRQAASAAGFQRYSEALKRSGITWTAKSLDQWLAGPQKLVPGNAMTFAGIGDPRARLDLVAYLKAVAEHAAPSGAKEGGTMMGGGGRRPDLKQPPPEGQVRAIRYCGDTYSVETADGKVEKIWEFNLRFKTDSSKLGPYPGKPVVLGAGMQGDRASVVFSSAKEISNAIRYECN